MINNYGLFYRHSKKNDVLIAVFNDDKKADKYVRNGDLGIVFSENQPIAYNFFNINKIVKIHAQSIIYLPSSVLIDVLNSLIGKKYEHLQYKENSGFKIVSVESMRLIPEKKKFLYYFKTGPKELVICDFKGEILNSGDVVVLADKGVMLPNGKKCDLNHVCTGEDLGFEGQKDIYKLDESVIIGSDFFQMEEN